MMRSHRAVTLLIAALICGGSAAAAPGDLAPTTRYSASSWTEKDGLPSQAIWSLAQDREGYLWVGTAKGLARFDGLRFVPVAPKEVPLTHIGVPTLYADSSGSIWRSFWGLARLDRIQGRDMRSYGPAEGLPNAPVSAILEDRHGTLWVGGGAGLARLQGDRWESLALPVDSKDLTIRSLHEDRAGNFWISTSLGVFRRPAGSHEFQRLGETGNLGRGFAEITNGSVWVVDQGLGLRQLSGPPVATAPRLEPSATSDAWRIVADTQSNVWIATNEGLIRQPVGRMSAPHHYTVETGLAGNVVLSVLEDRERNIWVATGSGLTRLSETPVSDFPVFDGAPGLVKAVTTEANGDLWIGTRKGLIHVANGTRREFGGADGLPSTSISALRATADGSVWIGTRAGLAKYSGGRIQPQRLSTTLGEITALTTGRDNALWICDRENGIFRLEAGALASLATVPELQYGPVSAIHTDRLGRIWVGFVKGSITTYADGVYRHFDRQDGLADGPVAGIFDDSGSADGVWVVTGTGLSRIAGGRVTTLSIHDGFPADKLAGGAQDADGNLWLGANDRLVSIHASDFEKAALEKSPIRFRLYDASDGLRGESLFEAGTPNIAWDRNGILWFVTSVGLFQLNPRAVVKQQTAPATKLEDIVVNDQRFDPASLIQVPPNPSQVQFIYTALTLSTPTKVRFRYMLEGFDDTWVDNGSSRRATYTNLPAGRYRFRVAGSSDNNSWHESDQPLGIVVAAAFYQTWWFYGLGVFTVALTVFVGWRLRIAHIQNRLADISSERARLSRELHDTLLQSLVALGLQLNNLSDELPSSRTDAIRQQLHRLGRQIKDDVAEARQIIWNLRRQPHLEDQDLVPTLVEHARALTTGTGIQVTANVTGDVRPCASAVLHQLLRITREAVTNAVRHARPNRISIDVAYGPSTVTLKVIDDGIGFVGGPWRESTDEHWGLTFMRERAEHIGGRLVVVSARETGTTIEATVPLNGVRTPALPVAS